MADFDAYAQVLGAPPAEVADTFYKQDRYKVLLQSVAAQVQGLQADRADIVTCARTRQSSLCDELGLFLEEFEPSSPL